MNFETEIQQFKNNRLNKKDYKIQPFYELILKTWLRIFQKMYNR